MRGKGEIVNYQYVQNMIAWLRRRDFIVDKYDCPGVYCIRVNGQIAYIGKSKNMLERIAAHYVGIKLKAEPKYRVLAAAQEKGYVVEFDALYYAQESTQLRLDDEIGEMEGRLIRKYLPILNTQIPKEENWHRWEIQALDENQALIELLG